MISGGFECYLEAVMLSPLRNRDYRNLYLAQLVALLGTGITTVALALLAFEIAGRDATIVLGIALAIKMVAYVLLSPIAGAYAGKFNRARYLVGLEIVRAIMVALLPFIDQVWQIYVLIFLLQSASAAYTPVFQATIPNIIPDEKEYTKALTLSRLSYDLESLVSPMLATLLLAFLSFHWLFMFTMVAFLISAWLVFVTRFPDVEDSAENGAADQSSMDGIRYYLATPRLQGLMALNLALAAAGSLVIVCTVVIVLEFFDGTQSEVGIALAAFGFGSMITAIFLPRLLEQIQDRVLMHFGAFILCLALAGATVQFQLDVKNWGVFLLVWSVIGVGYSAIITPTGRVLRRSSNSENRTSIFAAQFSLSHACWLVTYPLSGWLAATFGLGAAALVMAIITVISLLGSIRLWPADDKIVLSHTHKNLPADHPHVRDAVHDGKGMRHAHDFVIDRFHHEWPTKT